MDQYIIVLIVLVLSMTLFIMGKIRYDVTALMTLLSLSVLGIIPSDRVFSGFGHPAVITVAAILVVGKGLENGGVVDFIARWIGNLGDRFYIQMAALIFIVILASGFMNNIGALTLLIPVAIRTARRSNFSPSIILMPLAFGSLLGGLTTLIGTPPNIVIAMYRADISGSPFKMFDYTPVGLSVALAGGLFLATVGWRLVPDRQGKKTKNELFHIDDYLTELRITQDSPLANNMVSTLKEVAEIDVVIIGVVRKDKRLPAPSHYDMLFVDDILIIEAEPEDINELMETAKLELVGSKNSRPRNSAATGLMEVIVTHDSPIYKRTAIGLDLRRRHGINLLAVARRGKRVTQRLSKIRFQIGDILLLQGEEKCLQEAISKLGCLPLPERELQLGKPRRLILSVVIFATALFVAALGLLPIGVSMLCAVVTMILLKLVSLQEAYASIDWPIIVLLGSMIPVGEALETTGGAQQIATLMLQASKSLPPTLTMTLLLTTTMFLSDVINNTATAVLMAPIAIQISQGLNTSIDPFLMAVAIGSSCAFSTPIGHQSNTLVMGPGGYEFGDYWPSGLPLTLLIIVLVTILVPIFWPF